MREIVSALCLAAGLSAQPPAQRLSLAEAEQIALMNSPRLSSATLSAAASGKVVSEVRAARYPTLNGALTGVGAETERAIAAGALTTSSISNRAASGLTISQLITDFGRTADLTESAKLRATAQTKDRDQIRALVRLEVRTAYYQAAGSESVLQVAQASLSQRRTIVRQVSALTEASIKSTLDVSFAQVAASEAELGVFRAENEAHANLARLSAAMGFDREQNFTLIEEDLPSALESTSDSAIVAAIRDRPDLEALGLTRDAAHTYALAEAKLRYPTVTALAAGGVVPLRDHTLHDTYAAAGVNVNIPILNGGLFNARQAEAELRAQAAEKDIRAVILTISRDVQIAWLNATTAFRGLEVTARLVAQATEALRLAQSRYDAGLSGILELTQAQFAQTSAQIGAASAKFEYLRDRAILDYQMGALR